MSRAIRILTGAMVLAAAAAAQGTVNLPAWMSFQAVGFSGFTVTPLTPDATGYGYKLDIAGNATINIGTQRYAVTELIGFYVLRPYPIVNGAPDRSNPLLGPNRVQGAIFKPYSDKDPWEFGYNGDDSGEVAGWEGKSEGIRLHVPVSATFTFTKLENPADIFGYGFDLQYMGPGNVLTTGHFKFDGKTPPDSVPEPFTMGLLAAGLGIAALTRRRRA